MLDVFGCDLLCIGWYGGYFCRGVMLKLFAATALYLWHERELWNQTLGELWMELRHGSKFGKVVNVEKPMRMLSCIIDQIRLYELSWRDNWETKKIVTSRSSGEFECKRITILQILYEEDVFTLSKDQFPADHV